MYIPSDQTTNKAGNNTMQANTMTDSMCIEEFEGPSQQSSPLTTTEPAPNYHLKNPLSLFSQQKTATTTTTTKEEEEAATIAATNSSNTPSSASTDAEEVLNGAFQELEKERTRRIELEAQLRALQASSLSEASTSTSTATKKASKKTRRRSSTTSSRHYDASTTNNLPSQKDHAALQQELDGYKQIVNAMTHEKPAIAAALAASEARRAAVRTGHKGSKQQQSLIAPTLPLQVIHLLEIMPWDPQAQKHAFGTEEIFEWQIYSKQEECWSADMKRFPSLFQSMPTLPSTTNNIQDSQYGKHLVVGGADNELQSSRTHDRSWRNFLAICESLGKTSTTTAATNGGEGAATSASLTAPPDQSVLTNASFSHKVHLARGVSLPQDGGTWQWVGCWRIEKRVIVYVAATDNNTDSNNYNSSDNNDDISRREQRQTSLDVDEDGWSYAMDANNFLQDNYQDHCQDHAGAVQKKVTIEKATFLSGNQMVCHMVPLRTVRRRKWTRRRVLVDYPFASNQSKHFLQLLAQNASLTVAANQISDQLVETKMKLTETQLKTFQDEDDTKRKVAQLKKEIVTKEEHITKLMQKRALEEKKRQDDASPSPPPKRNTTISKPTTVITIEPHTAIAENGLESFADIQKPQDALLPAGAATDLKSLLSHWMVSPSRQLKMIPNGESNDGDGDGDLNPPEVDYPVSDDGSCSSSEAPAAEDRNSSREQEPQREGQESTGTETHPARRADDDSITTYGGADSSSRRNSFDWKKLGRHTMDKIKQGQAAASTAAPLLWLHKDSISQDGGESLSSRSVSPSSDFQPSEAVASQE